MICGRVRNKLEVFGLIALCACAREADDVVDVEPDPDSATSPDSAQGVETEPPAETPDLLDTPSDTPALDTDATSPETGATSGDSAQDTSSGLGHAEPLGPPPFVDLGARSPDLVGLVPCVASVASGGGPCLTHGLFVDLDRDGADEVVLLGLGTGVPGEGSTRVFRYDPGSDVLVAAPDLDAWFAQGDRRLFDLRDVDGDGAVDGVHAGWAQPIAWGETGAFVPDGGVERPGYDGGIVLGGWADVDRDGWVDRIQTGGCRPDAADWQVLRQEGPRVWVAQEAWRGAGPRTNPYTLGVLPNGLGAFSLFAMGNPCDAADVGTGVWLEVGRDAVGDPIFEQVDPLPTTSTWRYSPAVAFGPLSILNPMGAAFGDVDGDGVLELAVATTFSSLHWFAPAAGAWDERTDAAGYVLPPRLGPSSVDRVKPWSVWVGDLELDGDDDVLAVGGLDPADIRAGLGAIDRAVVWRTLATGLPDEVATAWDLGSPRSGRSLTVGDLDRDGAPDLILGGYGEVPRVVRHANAGARPALSVRWVGSDGNPDAIGAVVRIEDDGVLGPARLVGGVHASGPASPGLTFGTTGLDGVADALWVTTPEGWTWRWAAVSAGHHVQAMPQMLSVTPSSRRAVADGGAEIWIDVTPRDLDGAPRTGTVGVTLTHGVATVGTPTLVGDAWRVAVTSTTPGSVRLVVSVDGTPLAVAPRLWFDAP